MQTTGALSNSFCDDQGEFVEFDLAELVSDLERFVSSYNDLPLIEENLIKSRNNSLSNCAPKKRFTNKTRSCTNKLHGFNQKSFRE